MDCAKAAASIALTDDSIRKYHGTGVAMPQEHLPLIAVPTTAGTGSEVTCVSVLTDHANGKEIPDCIGWIFPKLCDYRPGINIHHAAEGYGRNRN